MIQEEGIFDNSSSDSREKALNEITALDGAEGNILTQYTEEQAMSMGRSYASKHGLDVDLFSRAAAVARSPNDFASMKFLSEEEKTGLFNEASKKLYMPRDMIAVVVMSSMAAAVQGMDESVTNGANVYFPKGLGIGSGSDRDSWLVGLVNSAPYLCCAILSCWLAIPLNKRFGRRWTIFMCCCVSAVCSFWSAFTNTWYHLFIARFCLGLGIGPMSATVPVYIAECAPAKIRGALVMCWQFFTATGIMVGYITGLAFYRVPDHGIGKGGLAWRLMIASSLLPAVFVCLQAPWCTESPRWLMGQERHEDAFNALKRLRKDEIAAARDCFYQFVLLEEEESVTAVPMRQKVRELFSVTRNRNAVVASTMVMFMQQFCGVNVIAYYSSTIFIESGFSELSALIASWGFGMLNIVGSIPSFYIIDTVGRRKLLLSTFPFMGVCCLLVGFAFWIPEETHQQARIGVISIGVYLFTILYSLGEGPVPFTYSAEAYPLYIRDLGMSLATAVCWFFNFVLAITWPSLLKAFKPQGAFGWYGAWNFVGFFLVLWLLPETKGLSLEELDEVFSVGLLEHANYQNKSFWNAVQRNVFRKNIPKLAPLHHSHRMAVTNPEWSNKAEAVHAEL